MSTFLTLEEILGKSEDELNAIKAGEFNAEKLGTVPFREIDHKEYKAIKRDCMTKTVDKKSRAVDDVMDDDKLMVKLVIAAVDKETQQPDKRSDFTFANEKLLTKLGVITAEAAVVKLMSIGEVYKAAMEIQTVCGFTEKAEEEKAEEIKN